MQTKGRYFFCVRFATRLLSTEILLISWFVCPKFFLWFVCWCFCGFHYHALNLFLFVSCLSHQDLSDDLPLCSHFGLDGRGASPSPALEPGARKTSATSGIGYFGYSLGGSSQHRLASKYWGQMRHLRLLGIFLIKVVGGVVVAPKVKDGSSRTQTVSSDALKAGRKYLITSFPQLKQVAPQPPWTKRQIWRIWRCEGKYNSYGFCGRNSQKIYAWWMRWCDKNIECCFIVHDACM